MFLYIICKIFGIVREKNFMILPSGEKKKVKFGKTTPNAIYYKSDMKYYNIIKITSEIVNDTLIYNWITVEEFI